MFVNEVCEILFSWNEAQYRSQFYLPSRGTHKFINAQPSGHYHGSHKDRHTAQGSRLMRVVINCAGLNHCVDHTFDKIDDWFSFSNGANGLPLCNIMLDVII